MKKGIVLLFILFLAVISGCENLTSNPEDYMSTEKLVFTKISSGTHFNLALTKDGACYGIGWNRFGQLGTGGYREVRAWTPVRKNIKDISVGYAHSLALDMDGILYAAGSNAYGQLGSNSRRKK
ncbi:hypothetical protein ACFLZV_07415, partial [Candidatus Margulisiibacteriota bacterium]